MKAQNNSGKSQLELNASLIQLKEAQFRLNMKKSVGQLEKSHQLKDNKKSIARIKTLLTQISSGK
jgi:large subunit ribosomal protein L29